MGRTEETLLAVLRPRRDPEPAACRLEGEGLPGQAGPERHPQVQARGRAMNSRYELIIYWSAEDNAFIAEVPELPGCAADGATYAEAVANVQTAIDEWIETARDLGRDIPEPRGRLAYA